MNLIMDCRVKPGNDERKGRVKPGNDERKGPPLEGKNAASVVGQTRTPSHVERTLAISKIAGPLRLTRSPPQH